MARLAVGDFGFLTLIQVLDGPERYVCCMADPLSAVSIVAGWGHKCVEALTALGDFPIASAFEHGDCAGCSLEGVLSMRKFTISIFAATIGAALLFGTATPG